MISVQTLLTLSLALTCTQTLALNIPRQSTNGTTSTTTSGGAPTLDSTATYTGDITYYNPAGGLGACGTALADTDAVAAVNSAFYGQYVQAGNTNNNPLCGRQIQLTYTDADSGAVSTATATIRDRCAACAATDIDLTPVVFDQLVPKGESVGRTTASWKFI